MDTIHDLGGRQGFGPIRWQDDDDDKFFHELWQARTWAICMIMIGQFRREKTGWTLDWHRHVIERIAPADYLTMNYFDKWAQHMMATLIDDGVANIQEFVDGHSQAKPTPIIPKTLSASADAREPKYSVGNCVLARRTIGSMHTRLPGFVRGCKGVVDVWHGPETLADASAVGDLRKEQLYTVRFESGDLWPEADGRPYSVRVDLWESYLETP
jgi:nitrile hydratase beta subunit